MTNRSIVRSEDLLPTFFSDFYRPWNEWFEDRWVKTVPAVNVTETEKSFTLELAVPGLSKEDFNIRLDNGVLTISAEKETERKAEEDKFTRREYNYSSFTRSFSLPENCNPEKIDAKYDNGVLKLMLPKKEFTKKQEALKVSVK